VKDDFNPYQPPTESDRETKPSKKLTILDWTLAIVLGSVAIIATFFSTCIGVALSFLASDFEVLAPIVLGFCFFFSIGVGCSAASNYLTRKSRAKEGSVAPMRSFRLERSSAKLTKLDKLLTGCGTGLLALIVLLPSSCILLAQLSEAVHLSPKASENAQLLGHVTCLCLSLFVGCWYWQRISSR